jgi:hypothetical protein
MKSENGFVIGLGPLLIFRYHVRAFSKKAITMENSEQAVCPGQLSDVLLESKCSYFHHTEACVLPA